MKKQLFILSAAVIAATAATAQTGTGIGTITPNSSAMLDVTASNKGVLMPRVTLQSVTDATTIAAPATGLVVYNTNTALAAGVGLYYNAGTPTTPLWSRMVAMSAASAPATGQTIIWNGTTYVTGNPAIAVAAGTPLSGNGTGSTPLTINVNAAVYNAANIQGKAVSSTAPTNGQVLVWNSANNKYEPGAAPGDNWGTQTAATTGAAISGDGTAAMPLAVNNTLPIFNANKINSSTVSNTAPGNGQTLVYDAATATYIPGNPGISTTGTTFTGNGTPGMPLTFNGVAVSTPVTGNGTSTSPLSVNTALAVYNANNLQGKAISTTAPTSGQVLLWNAVTNEYVPTAVPGDNWGAQTAVTSGAAISGNGTGAMPLTVNNTAPIFNANQLNNTAITGTPATGQSIVYNGTSYAPGNPAVSAGNGITGNGTSSNPLAFSGISTTGTPLSGNGTSGSPLSINTTLPVYNAGTIQGNAVSTTAPTTNQVLVWNGTNYIPSVVNAAQIQGKTVSNTAPTNGQVLIYNSTTNSYVPSAVPGDNWGTQTAATTGAAISGNGTAATPLTVNNTSPIFNANQLNNTAITGTPTTGQSVVYNGTSYAPGNPAVSAGNGITGNGTPSNPLAFSGVTAGTGLTGNGTSGSPLVFSGVVASAPLGGAGTTASPLTINTASPVYNANNLQGKAISTTAPTNGQVLIYNTATNSYVPSAVPGDNWGTHTGATSGAAISGNGTAATPLTVNNTAPIFNAGTIQGNAVSTTAPTTNQVLVWNGTNYVPSVVNAAQIQGKTVSNTAPTNGQILIYNSTTNSYVPSAVPGDNWGTQTAVTSGAAISGNGTAATPLMVNNTSPIFNANQLNNTAITGTPTTGQSVVYNGTSYAPGNPSITTGGTSFTGNGTPGSPLTFGGVVANAPLSGAGTTASPLTINTAAPVYNANNIQGQPVSTTAPTANQVLAWNGTSYVPSAVNATQIQGKTVSTTGPTNGQSLVWNSTTNQYTPVTVASSASNGLNLSGSDVRLGGTITQPTTITTAASNTLTIAGTASSTTFDGQGNIHLQGLQAGYGNVLVVDNTGVVKQIPASATTFNYNTFNTSGVHLSSSQLTGAVPYAQNSVPNGSIPGGGSWTPIPGLSKTITIANPTNTVYFNTEGVTQYDGTMNGNGVTSYSIGIFIDGKLMASRSYTMIAAGSTGQFDTYNLAGQCDNLSSGNHTFGVYVTRRMQQNASDDLYFCGPATIGNTNAFMTRGVLFISGTY